MTAEQRIRAALPFSGVPNEAGFRFRLLAEEPGTGLPGNAFHR